MLKTGFQEDVHNRTMEGEEAYAQSMLVLIIDPTGLKLHSLPSPYPYPFLSKVTLENYSSI